MKAFAEEALEALANGTAIVTAAMAVYCDPPVFLWGGDGTATIDGDVYLPLSNRSMIKSTGGAIGGSEQNFEAALSGIEPEVLDLLDATEVNSAPAKVYRMVFDSSGTRILDCRVWKRGRVDSLTTTEVIGGEASISVSIEPAARGLGRKGKRMRSDADQRLIDPEDGFFKHCSYAGEKVVYFGGKPSSASALSGGG